MVKKLKIRESHWEKPNDGWHWDNAETNEYTFMYKGKTYRSNKVKDNTIIPWRTLEDCISALVRRIDTNNLDIDELVIHKTNNANYIIEQWSGEDAYNLILEFERTGCIKESYYKESLTSTEKKFIDKVKKVALRDDYDQDVYYDENGELTFMRRYPKNGVNREDLIGVVHINWTGGIPKAEFIAKESVSKRNIRNNYIKESDYGYTQNGEEIDESTVEELYRMAEYELLPQSELARVFGADNISIDEDTFEYYATGSAWGAYMKYDILIDVNTGSYGNRFNLNKFINPNYDDIHPDFDVRDTSFDIVVKVDGDKVTAKVDLNPRNISIEDDYTDWFAKRFGRMLDIEAIEKDVETIAERDVYEIKSVLSNI